jgi:hypothetical protein
MRRKNLKNLAKIITARRELWLCANSIMAIATLGSLLLVTPLAGLTKQVEDAQLNPTGKYDMRQGLQSGILWVQDIKGKTGDVIKFHLFSQYNRDPNSPNIGELVGMAPIKNNHAVYDGGEDRDHLKMTFDFSQNKVSVGCKEPEKFGGAHVDPAGIYKQTSHQPPKAADMKYSDQ